MHLVANFRIWNYQDRNTFVKFLFEAPHFRGKVD